MATSRFVNTVFNAGRKIQVFVATEMRSSGVKRIYEAISQDYLQGVTDRLQTTLNEGTLELNDQQDTDLHKCIIKLVDAFCSESLC